MNVDYYKKQFRHVSCEENGGTPPEKSNGGYTDVINLDIMDGFEVKTITNKFFTSITMMHVVFFMHQAA